MAENTHKTVSPNATEQLSLELFDEIQEQIDWAKTRSHLGFDAFIEYAEADAFVMVVEDDLKTGDRVSKLKLVKHPPAAVKGHFRNAVVDLKHSFDMSLHAAAQTLGANRFKGNYPWSDTAAGLDSIIARRQEQTNTRLPEILIDEIRRQKPYAGDPTAPGTEYLVREIAKMANDKHTIGFVATAAITSFAMKFDGNTGQGGTFSVGGAKWDPAKKELELARAGGGGSVSHQGPTVETNIFFKRAGLVGEVPAKAVVAAFAARAEMVLEGFKSACAKAR